MIYMSHNANGDTISNTTPDPVITREVNKHLHGADITHAHTDHTAGSSLSVGGALFLLFTIALTCGAFVGDLF